MILRLNQFQTVVVSQNQISCLLEKYFDDPLHFVPERWLKTENQKQINPHLVLPFGHGARSCIARRFAEQNILALLLRVSELLEAQMNGIYRFVIHFS